MPPTTGNGKVCYLEIPAVDVEASAAFYAEVFGWRLRTRTDGRTAFDDGVGEVSGTWVLGRSPSREAGIVISIMVDDAEATVAKITEAGGTILRPLDPEDSEIIAWFSDPGGNLMGIYQEPRA